MAEKVAGKIFFTGIVKDNEDIFLLNRIRVFPEKEETISQVLRDLNENLLLPDKSDVKDSVKYTKEDPFVFYPLLPFFITIIPKVNDLVWVTYSNPSTNGNGRKEQFYFPVAPSFPFNLAAEESTQAKANTSQGFNIGKGTSFKSVNINPSNGKKDYTEDIEGIFAEPGDNAIYGQGTTDLILKPTEVLIRAGKIEDLQPNTINLANEKRAFFQLSYFQTKKTKSEPKSIVTKQVDKSQLKKLVEYGVINPENTMDSFTGSINIYNISSSFPSDEFNQDTVVPNNVLSPVWSYQFNAQSLKDATTLINMVINGLNDGYIVIDKPPLAKITKTFSQDSIFPFYYRPDVSLNNTLKLPQNNINAVKKTNAINLISGVKFKGALIDFDGSGLVPGKNLFGTVYKNVKTSTTNTSNVLSKNSVSILCSSKIVLLTHDTTIPGKKPINLKKDTIYGLEQSFIENDILSNTDCLVRGEKLKELLNLIVQFLITHTHSFPMLPPLPVSYSGVDISKLTAELELYNSKVLNQNIRIN